MSSFSFFLFTCIGLCVTSTDLTNRSSSLAPTGQPSSEPPDQIGNYFMDIIACQLHHGISHVATGSTEPSSFKFSPSARSLTDLPQPASESLATFIYLYVIIMINILLVKT